MNHFPSTHCQWAPTERGTEIEAVGEKFYGSMDWLRFLLEHFLIPWGYQLTGTVSYQGEQGSTAGSSSRITRLQGSLRVTHCSHGSLAPMRTKKFIPIG